MLYSPKNEITFMHLFLSHLGFCTFVPVCISQCHAKAKPSSWDTFVPPACPAQHSAHGAGGRQRARHAHETRGGAHGSVWEREPGKLSAPLLLKAAEAFTFRELKVTPAFPAPLSSQQTAESRW